VFPFFSDRIRGGGEREPGQNIGSFSSSEGREGMRHESGKIGTWQVKRHRHQRGKAEWKEEEIRAKGDQAVAVEHTVGYRTGDLRQSLVSRTNVTAVVT
jgi:hypothetical protein